VRRLAIALLSASAAAAVLGAGGQSASAQERPGPVDVLQVSGLFDPIVVAAIDDAIERSTDDGAQALVLQINTRGAVVPR
jgi:membrane-bound serine protease (ClpP class)